MTPEFRAGDLVVDNAVTREQAARLVPGDIITFHVPGASTELVTHRIVAVQHTTGTSGGAPPVRYQTKGDANDSPDVEAVSPNQIVGSYRMHIAYGGYVLRAVRTKTVYFFLILIPLLYLIGSIVAKGWREPVAALPRRKTQPDADDSATDRADMALAISQLTDEQHAGEGGGSRM